MRSKKSSWLFIFFVALAADLLGIHFRNTSVVFVAKPMLMISLLAAIFQTGYQSDVRKKLVTALLFSFAGDVFLMFEYKVPSFFIYGLVSFLIAHVFYILIFIRIWKRVSVSVKWTWAIPVAIYYGALLYLLFPSLGFMKIPVTIYGAVISIMLFSALQLVFSFRNGSLLVVAGAVLFVLSDSLLAINRFHTPVLHSGLLIMATYAAAQYCLVKGIVKLG